MYPAVRHFTGPLAGLDVQLLQASEAPARPEARSQIAHGPFHPALRLRPVRAAELGAEPEVRSEAGEPGLPLGMSISVPPQYHLLHVVVGDHVDEQYKPAFLERLQLSRPVLN